MKFWFCTLALLGYVFAARAQTTIFSENMGSPAATTAITSYTGFQNYGTYTYTGSGDVRTSTASSGYTGASGSGNVFLTNTAGTNFQIAGINTSSCSSFTLSFGIYKNSTTSNGSELTLEVSTDGVTYSSLTVPALSTGAGTAKWYLVTITSGIPSTSNLRIRFTNNTTGGAQIRIDDVILTGTCGSSSLSTGTVTPTSISWSCGGVATATVSYSSTGVFNAGNVFTFQLSNASGSFSSPVDVAYLSSTASSGTVVVTIPSSTSSGTGYEIQVVSSNPAITGNPSATFTISAPTCCPYMTGSILNSCDNGVAGCNEGDAEVMFFNSGSYSISVSSLPAHVVNYYGSAANFSSNTINAYTGTFSANSSTTSALNSSTGCSSSFIDAATAGTIPANSTIMMVPSNFCYTNYDFSNLCGAYSPIYVLYFATTGWNASGNLANNQSGSNPKYITADFTAIAGGCKTYYTFDAGAESSGNGSGVAFATPASTSSASPTNPDAYTSASCTLPLVLPTNLISFSAEKTSDGKVKLRFVTAEENSLQQFIISKSTDAVNFSQAVVVNPTNTEKQTAYIAYDFIDKSETGIYYKLEEVDVNGINRFLALSYLDDEAVNEIRIIQDENGLGIESPVLIRSVTLYSAGGIQVAGAENVNGSAYRISLENLQPGFYILQITDTNEKTTIKKIIH